MCKSDQTLPKTLADDTISETELSLDYTFDSSGSITELGHQNETTTPLAGLQQNQLLLTTKPYSKSDVHVRAGGFIDLHNQNKDGIANASHGPDKTIQANTAVISDCIYENTTQSITDDIEEMNSFDIIDSLYDEVELDVSLCEQTDQLIWNKKVTSPMALAQIEGTPTAYGGLKKLKSHATTNIKEKYGHDFELIRTICEKDGDLEKIDYDPRAFEEYKITYWPQWAIEDNDDLAYTYTIIRDSGLPNSMCQKVPLHSKLNVKMWESYLPEPKYKELIDGMKYGYSLGYIGPISYHSYNKNHSSAENFPHHIEEYLKKELDQDTLMGPFETVPFEFCHTSPLMTREKSTSNKRRVISDMKFPIESSINAYIPKNTILGKTRPHHLPKSDDIITAVDFTYGQYYLYTLDIENAYKNLPVDPLDWPLLTFRWKGKYYIENRLPFGSRNSSVTMQTVASAIIDILKKFDITSWMYLDDLLVMSKGWAKAQKDVQTVTEIFKKLGLPTVPAKAQGLAQAVTWIGVVFNMADFTISVPETKLDQVIQNIQALYHRDTVTLTEMQSIVGKIVHISKCIIPSRIFTSRILAAMRKNEEGKIKITKGIRKDFDWFINFAVAWNGTANMNPRKHIRTFQTSYESPFLMATDNNYFYICNIQKTECRISDLQATVLNIAMAIDLFTQESDCEGQTVVTSNMKSAVQAYNIGNTRDDNLDKIVRANWFTYALANKDYKIQFQQEKCSLFSELLNAVKGHNPYNLLSKISETYKINQIYPNSELFNDYISKLSYRSTDV